MCQRVQLRILTSVAGVVVFEHHFALLLYAASVLLNLLDFLADIVELSIDAGSGLVQLHERVEGSNFELLSVDLKRENENVKICSATFVIGAWPVLPSCTYIVGVDRRLQARVTRLLGKHRSASSDKFSDLLGGPVLTFTRESGCDNVAHLALLCKRL